MITHDLVQPDPSLLLEQHAAYLLRGETLAAGRWAQEQVDPEMRSLMRLAERCQDTLVPLALPAAAKGRLRRDLLAQAQAGPAVEATWRAQSTALARRSIEWLGRPEGRRLLGGGSALAAGLGLVLALRRRQVLRAGRQGA